MSAGRTTQYDVKIGESVGINGAWIWGGAIKVAGYPGEVLWLNAGRNGENLNALDPVPFMFFALEGGRLVDVTQRLNVDGVSSVITRNIAVGDFNQDGLPDIFLANHGTEAYTPFPGEQNRLLIQTPDGKFKDGTSGLPAITDFTHVPGVGDLNNNGKLDLYINNLGDDENTPSYILLNKGDAQFVYHADAFLNNNGVIDPRVLGYIPSPISAIVDVDMDGKNDIFFGPLVRWNDGAVRDDGAGYLRNNDGKFKLILDDRLSWPTGSSNIFTALTADLNNDGYDDVVIVGGNPADSPGDSSNGSMMVQVYASGPGGLQNVSSSVLDLSSLRGIPIYGGIDLEIADINGNGSLDIEVRSWISNFSSQARWTFFNDGFGNFGAPVRDLHGVAASKGAYVDLNGDGIKDFVFPQYRPWDGVSTLSVVYGTKDGLDRFFRGSKADDLIVGAAGFNNTAIISAPFEQLTGFDFTSDGRGFVLESSQGRDTLIDIAQVQFADVTQTAYGLRGFFTPSIAFSVQTAEGPVAVKPVFFTGAPALNLHYQLIDDTPDVVVVGSALNDFIALQGGGVKAVDGGGGNDVIDGGVGSTFISGGGGSNIFFLDGRASGVSWSTITDFSIGTDKATIWGWKQGVSQVVRVDEFGGAPGYEGVTLHFENLLPSGASDADRNGSWNSITFSGKSLEDFGASSMEMLSAQIAAGTNAFFITGQTFDEFGTHGYLHVA
jgi:hypothetical protein